MQVSKDLQECLELTKQAYAKAVEICNNNGASLYQFTEVKTGKTWIGPMPEGSPIPNAKVTIGYPATEQLVIQQAPFQTTTVKEAFEKHHELRADLTVVKPIIQKPSQRQ